MPQEDTEKSGAERREQIIAAAESLFIDHGYEGASMSALAKRAGISKSLIYHHFSSKDELWDEVLFRHTDRFVQTFTALSNNPHEYTAGLYRDIMQALYCFLAENPGSARLFQWALLRRSPAGEQRATRAEQWVFIQMMLENIRRGQERGSIRSDIPPAHLLAALMGMIFFWFQTQEVLAEHAPLSAEDEERAFDSMVRLFFQGSLPR